MGIGKLGAIGGAVVAFLLSGTASASSQSNGTAYFDLSALTAALTSNTSNFSGWSYDSQAAAWSGSVGEALDASVPDLSASAGADGKATTTAGNIYVEAQPGATGSAYQHIRATFEVAAGQHFSYSVPYALSIHNSYSLQQIDLGAGFRYESDDTVDSVSSATSTALWPLPVGTVAKSGVLDIDAVNYRGTSMRFTIDGYLRADSYAATSPVPELPVSGLTTVGLAVLAAARRRRLRQAAVQTA